MSPPVFAYRFAISTLVSYPSLPGTENFCDERVGCGSGRADADDGQQDPEDDDCTLVREDPAG